ncbi:hypothetical protein ACOMHN_041103 [Nucella lapillus]
MTAESTSHQRLIGKQTREPLSALSDGPRAALHSVGWPYSRSPLCRMALEPLSALSDGPRAALRSVQWP